MRIDAISVPIGVYVLSVISDIAESRGANSMILVIVRDNDIGELSPFALVAIIDKS